MNFSFEPIDDGVCVLISGVFTFDDHERFKSVLIQIEETEGQSVRLDLSGTEMIDSAAIGMLLLANDRASKTGKALTLTGVQGNVAKVLELAKVDQVLTVQR